MKIFLMWACARSINYIHDPVNALPKKIIQDRTQPLLWQQNKLNQNQLV